MSQHSIRCGCHRDEYLSKEEMDQLCNNRLIRYFRAMKRTYWADSEVATDPSCLERWKEVKRIAKEILAKRLMN